MIQKNKLFYCLFFFLLLYKICMHGERRFLFLGWHYSDYES